MPSWRCPDRAPHDFRRRGCRPVGIRALIPFVIAAWACAGEAPRPLVVLIGADEHYGAARLMADLGAELTASHGLRHALVTDRNDQAQKKAGPPGRYPNDLQGLDALDGADLLVIYMRWRALPPAQVARLQRHIDAGKPLVGIRTATHAFQYAADDPLARWNTFGADILGAPWLYHYGHKSSTDVAITPDAVGSPLLRGVAPTFHVRSWLYHIRPDHPPKDATVLLSGSAVDSERRRPEPNPVAWTRKTATGGRVFATTLGGPEDFAVADFRRLLVNGIHWALGRAAP